ncbi:unnamed protein product [Rhizophagus irregularis]|nr:unnamed protein product [Rhizophagus irregularis]
MRSRERAHYGRYCPSGTISNRKGEAKVKEVLIIYKERKEKEEIEIKILFIKKLNQAGIRPFFPTIPKYQRSDHVRRNFPQGEES